MNKEFFKQYKKEARMILSRQPKMSLAEIQTQADRVMGSTNQSGKSIPKTNSETSEDENPQT